MNNIDIFNDKELKKGIKTFLETAPDVYMAGVSVDTVIFGFHNDNEADRQILYPKYFTQKLKLMVINLEGESAPPHPQ